MTFILRMVFMMETETEGKAEMCGKSDLCRMRLGRGLIPIAGRGPVQNHQAKAGRLLVFHLL